MPILWLLHSTPFFIPADISLCDSAGGAGVGTRFRDMA